MSIEKRQPIVVWTSPQRGGRTYRIVRNSYGQPAIEYTSGRDAMGTEIWLDAAGNIDATDAVARLMAGWLCERYAT